MRYISGEEIIGINGHHYVLTEVSETLDSELNVIESSCKGIRLGSSFGETEFDYSFIDHDETAEMNKNKIFSGYTEPDNAKEGDLLYLKTASGTVFKKYKEGEWVVQPTEREELKITDDRRYQLSEKELDRRLKQVNSIKPPHYRKGDIDLIESWYLTMPFEGFRWAMKSHIDKYVYRYEQKNGVEDLDKAAYYIKRLKEKELEE